MWFIPNVPNEIKHQRETDWGARVPFYRRLRGSDIMKDGWNNKSEKEGERERRCKVESGEGFYDSVLLDVTALTWYARLTREGDTGHVCRASWKGESRPVAFGMNF